jgi:hypothetical protein
MPIDFGKFVTRLVGRLLPGPPISTTVPAESLANDRELADDEV